MYVSPMMIIVSNNYGGDICRLIFQREEKDDYFGIAVRIQGYIETVNARIQHVTSLGRFVKDEMQFRIPKNIIPSLETKNFKVEYELDCEMIYKDKKSAFKAPIKINNNNLFDFNYKDTLVIDLNMISEDEFVRSKESICKLLLESMKMNKDPMQYFKEKQTSLAAKCESVSFIENRQEFASPGSYSTELDIQELIAVTGDHTIVMDNTAAREEDVSASSKDVKDTTAVIEHESMPIETADRTTNTLNNSNPVDNLTNKIIDKIPMNLGDDDLKMEVSKELKAGLNEVIAKILEEKNKAESEMLEKFKRIQKETPVPVFPDLNLHRFKDTENLFLILENDEKIGQVSIKSTLPEFVEVRIEYFRDVKDTQIEIWREDSCGGKLIDVENQHSIVFDSENCLEKTFQFKINGFTLHTFAFDISFMICVILDGSEARIPIEVIAHNCLFYSEDVIQSTVSI